MKKMSLFTGALIAMLAFGGGTGHAGGRTWEVIDQANTGSSQKPDKYGYANAIMNYDYVPGYLFKVYTAPLRVTDIQLQPGEKMTGTPVAGDVVRWVLGTGKSVKNGLEQQHVYIKPTKPGLKTTMVINTNKRTYHIELHSYRETYMAAITWNYPQESLKMQIAENERVIAPGIDLNAVHFEYDVDVKKGRGLHWKPLRVFDDGRQTFIQFPKAMLNREAPVLFIGAGKKAQLVNYRVKKDYYIVDRLFDVAELRLGEKSQKIVRITRQ